MASGALSFDLRRFFDVRPGEAARVGVMAAFLFFLLAANNVIKIVRDSLFLSRFPITQLPYVYLLAALIATVVIVVYSRYASRLPFAQVVLASLGVVVSNIFVFWLLVTFYDAAWVLYAYYMWSAIIGLVLVAQFWTLANEMFTPRDGKRLFGIITAGGTLGAMLGGFMANWAVGFLFGAKHLLWLIAALLAAAYGVAYLALRKREALTAGREAAAPGMATEDVRGVVGTVLDSRYLQTIAAVIFLSVVVSTLIDYQFKATAKEAYPSADALAGFFGSYYGWLSVVTMAAQLWLSGKILLGLGLTPSLAILPVALLGGSISLLAWPGLFAATATRMAEAALRTSIHQSGVQILYLPVPDSIKKKAKVFMDVTVERLGDAAAAILILFLSLVLGQGEVTLLSYFSVGLIVIWIAVVLNAHKGYLDTLRRSLAHHELSLDAAQINFADTATVEAIVGGLDGMDEQSILFALDLAEKMDALRVAAQLPRTLLSHPSPEVRRRALTLVASSLDSNVLAMVFELLVSDRAQSRGEAINTLATVLKRADILAVRPLLQSPERQTRRAAIRLMFQSGDAPARQEALAAFHDLVMDFGSNGESSRVEAARLMGELAEPLFAGPLSRLIKDDPSPAVIREAMSAAALGKYPAVIPEVISRLSNGATKTAAREALIQYGEMAVKGLRSALADGRVSRDLRLYIPKTLSKIHAQAAMNALHGGLLDEDRAIRFEVILALKEMARRFEDLKIDRQIIESAIMSDAQLYFRRFVMCFALFNEKTALSHQDSLLYHALVESMERVKERVMWLLSLIYSGKDIRPVWSGLNSKDPLQRAHATELLDNLLTGHLKNYVFPLYDDGQPDQRLRMALNSLGMEFIDTDSALRALLAQDDRWLKAATVWEIGLRKLSGYRNLLSKLAGADDPMLRETASIVIERIQPSWKQPTSAP